MLNLAFLTEHRSIARFAIKQWLIVGLQGRALVVVLDAHLANKGLRFLQSQMKPIRYL